MTIFQLPWSTMSDVLRCSVDLDDVKSTNALGGSLRDSTLCFDLYSLIFSSDCCVTSSKTMYVRPLGRDFATFLIAPIMEDA